MRILVLGANGRIGRAVFHTLTEQFPAAEILGAVRRPHLHFEGCTGDTQHRSIAFNPYDDMQWKSIGKLDVIVNCIGAIEERSDFPFVRMHVQLAQEILKHRALVGNPRIIQVSALGADVQQPSAFLRTKGEADDLLLAENDTYVLRPSIVCAEGTMLVRKLLLLRRLARFSFSYLPVPEMLCQRHIQPVLVDDLADAIMQLCKAPFEERIIEATGPDEIRIGDLLQLVMPNVHLLQIPEKRFEILYNAIRPLAARLLQPEEYRLLKSDNVAGNEIFSKLLGRAPRSTKKFWETELHLPQKQARMRAQKQAFA